MARRGSSARRTPSQSSSEAALRPAKRQVHDADADVRVEPVCILDQRALRFACHCEVALQRAADGTQAHQGHLQTARVAEPAAVGFDLPYRFARFVDCAAPQVQPGAQHACRGQGRRIVARRLPGARNQAPHVRCDADAADEDDNARRTAIPQRRLCRRMQLVDHRREVLGGAVRRAAVAGVPVREHRGHDRRRCIRRRRRQGGHHGARFGGTLKKDQAQGLDRPCLVGVPTAIRLLEPRRRARHGVVQRGPIHLRAGRTGPARSRAPVNSGAGAAETVRESAARAHWILR